jgi:sec-independent protein translocase protein TatB
MFPENRFMEFVIIGALALIVIGPKDLPMVLRRIGRVVGKMRAMAAEFRASFDELARQSELDELRREVEALRKGTSLTGDAEDPHATGVFDEIKNNLSLRMTPAMTPLPPSEAVPEPATPAVTAEPEPAPAKTVRKPRAKAVSADGEAPTRRATRKASSPATDSAA